MSSNEQVHTLFRIKTSNGVQLLEVKESDSKFKLEVTQAAAGDGTEEDIVSILELPHHLLSSSDLLIIDSVNSGTGRSVEKNIYNQVLKPVFELLNIGHYKYISTESAHDISDLAKSLTPEKPKTIVFISGDTSINELVNNLSTITTSQCIAFFNIPSGTGNALCRSIGLNSEVQAVQEFFTSAKYNPLSLYEAKLPPDSYYISNNAKVSEVKFIVVFSWCFHASLVADSDTPEMRKHGIQRFQIAAQENLNREQSYHGDTTIKENGSTKDSIDGPFSYWLLTPVNRFEPKFVISPNGNLQDSDLYLVAFNSRPNEELLEIMKEVYDNGSHVKDDRVYYIKIGPSSKVNLKVDETELTKKRFCLDGSIIALEGGNEIEISYSGNIQSGWKLFIIT